MDDSANIAAGASRNCAADCLLALDFVDFAANGAAASGVTNHTKNARRPLVLLAQTWAHVSGPWSTRCSAGQRRIAPISSRMVDLMTRKEGEER